LHAPGESKQGCHVLERERLPTVEAPPRATLAEDASQVRLGAGPTVLPTLRDTALRLLRWVGCRKIAERLREHSQHPAAAVAVLLRHPPQNA
jgi:hypothetical protein